MKIIKTLLLIVVALVALLLISVFFLSNDYAIERTIVIDAPPEQVHVMVGDLANWDQWSPWKEIDPSLEVTIPDQSTGIGATQNWSGKDGDGSLTLTRSDSGGIEYDMVFIAGEKQLASQSSMLYDETDEGTKVTWSMSGSMDGYLGKVMAFMMPRWVAKDFDRGLSNLKEAVESMPQAKTQDPSALNDTSSSEVATDSAMDSQED